MSAHPQTGLGIAPKVYCTSEEHLLSHLVAEGTDGRLYRVPAMPGGWRGRYRYEGLREELKAVSEQKARAIVEFVGGYHKDWEGVTIATGSTAAQPQYWYAPQGDVQTAG